MATHCLEESLLHQEEGFCIELASSKFQLMFSLSRLEAFSEDFIITCSEWFCFSIIQCYGCMLFTYLLILGQSALLLYLLCILTIYICSFTDNAGLCGIPGLRTCGPHLSAGAKVGIALGALLLLLLIGVCSMCWWKRRQNILRAQQLAGKDIDIKVRK